MKEDLILNMVWKKNHAMQGVEAELESGEIGNMDALTEEISEKRYYQSIKSS